MIHHDTDTTQTDWSEFGQPEKTERCPVTGVPTALKYDPRELCSDKLADCHAELGGRSKSKLQVMFDKFLYQK